MSTRPFYKTNKLALFSALTAAMVITSGCQSLKTANATNQPTMMQGQNADQPKKLENFNITGKIGVTTPANDTAGSQGGSAFYAWGQENDRFAIELIGALGIGKPTSNTMVKSPLWSAKRQEP